jgi:hypothetical protein
MTIRWILLSVLLAGPLHAQERPRPGQEVRVETAEEIHHGTLHSFGPDTLRLDIPNRRPVLIPRPRVLGIEVPVRERRARVVAKRALLGLAVGVVGGFLAGAYVDDQLDVPGVSTSFFVLVGAESGVVVGAISGALERIPTRWVSVYP